jgi:hypothetical protein
LRFGFLRFYAYSSIESSKRHKGKTLVSYARIIRNLRLVTYGIYDFKKITKEKRERERERKFEIEIEIKKTGSITARARQASTGTVPIS